jgi:cyanate permease
LLFGLLHELSGSWTASFTLLGACLLALTAGLLMTNQPRMLEDHLPGLNEVGTADMGYCRLK